MKYLIKPNTSLFIKKVSLPFFLFLLSISVYSQTPNPEEPSKEVIEKKKIDKDVVSDLTATISSDSISVDLKWTPPLEEGDLIIARSNEVIDTMEKLGISDSLGKFKNGKVEIFNSHQDVNLRPGTYYYAIVLVSQVKKKRVKLYPGVNYTVTPITVLPNSDSPVIAPKISEVKPETDSISNLKIRKTEEAVLLTWTPPLDAEKNSPKYTIYRSFEPMSSVGLMEKAVKIGEAIHPDTTFLDKELDSSQTVYYGVSVMIGDKETTPLVDRKSFHKFYFVKEEKIKETGAEIKVLEEKKEPKIIKPLFVTDLKAELRADGILLSWTSPEGATDNSTMYYIYESPTPILVEATSQLVESAKRIGTVVSPDRTFIHPNLDRKNVIYYGVSTKTGEGDENKILKDGSSAVKVDPENSGKKKKKKKKKEKLEKNEIKSEEKEKPPTIIEEPNPDFDTIMGNYYKKERYKEALVKFKSLADRVNDKQLRAKSLFFAALCHYNMQEFKDALKILLKEDVQINYEKERVDFYVKRCLEKRGIK